MVARLKLEKLTNAVPRETTGSKYLLLNSPSQAGYVVRGGLDIFATEMDAGGEPVGRRNHLVSIESGGLFFGFPMGEESGNICFLAAGAPGTQVILLTPAEMQAACRGNEPGLAALVDEWLSNVTAGVVTTLSPRHLNKEADPGTQAEFAPGERVHAREGVLWVRHVEGQSRFCGRDDLPVIDGDFLFPLSDPAWLVPEQKSTLAFVATSTWLETDPSWSMLPHFQGFILHCVSRNIAIAEEEDRVRMAERLKSDAARTDEALRTFTSILQKEGEAPTGITVSSREAEYLAATIVVGRELGIEVRTPPNWRQTKNPVDPLEDIARASRFRTRRVALAGEWWHHEHGPMLARMDGTGQPVALIPTSSHSYDLVNPADRSRIRIDRKIAQTIEPFADMFYRAFPDQVLSSWAVMVFGIRSSGVDLTTMIMMAMGLGLLGMVTPMITGYVFDTVIPNAELNMLAVISLALLSCSIATLVYTAARSIAILRLQGRVDLQVQCAMWDRLLSLPVPFFRNYSAGDLARRVMGVTEIQNTLTGTTIGTIISSIFASFSFFLLFYYSWRLALVACALILVELMVVGLLAWLQIRQQRKLVNIQGRISGMVLQMLTGISKLRVSGTEDRAFAVWANAFTKQKTVAYKAGEISNLTASFNNAFPTFSNICIFFCMIWWFDASPLTTGSFLAFNSAFGQFLTASLDMVSAVIGVLAVVPTWERAKPIMQTLPEVDEAKADPGELAGALEISHVMFRYKEDAPRILTDISLRIEPGEFVALVGPSGSGKSTLFRLMLGFEKPEAGAVYYDGQDLGKLDVRAVRRQIGVVLQDGALMSGDIFSNIVGSSRLTLDDAWEAARMAGLEEDIKALPMGMQTVVSQGGRSFSGGQRQRMLIARAIVNKPRILYFDEATSALDNRTQAIVSESLKRLRATRVVIAHRLSTVIDADRIFVLVNGELVETGTFQELMKLNGHLTELARRQMLAPEPQEHDELARAVEPALAATETAAAGSET